MPCVSSVTMLVGKKAGVPVQAVVARRAFRRGFQPTKWLRRSLRASKGYHRAKPKAECMGSRRCGIRSVAKRGLAKPAQAKPEVAEGIITK